MKDSHGFRARLLTIAIPPISDIVFVAVFCTLIFSSNTGLLGDGDTGYHITTGQVILRSWSIPTKDLYSFHRPPLPWTAHEWLSEVLMGAIFKWRGLTGVVFFFAALLALAHYLLFRDLRSRRSDEIILCTLVTMVATVVSSVHWLARPHVFSLFLIILWNYLLDRFQSTGKTRILYYFPFIMLFWVNLHAGFVMGLILLGIYSVGNYVTSLTADFELSGSGYTKVKPLFLTLFACLAVCLVNPRGFDIFLFPFRLTSNQFLMDNVIEFLSPNFHQLVSFKYMLLIMIASFALSRSALGFIDISLVLLMSYMSLYSARYVSLFAVILAPVLLKTISGILQTVPEPLSAWFRTRNLRLSAIDNKGGRYIWPTASLAIVLVLAMTGVISYGFDQTKFPVNAVEFLKHKTISGNIFNDDEFGDYMIFAAWPAYRVFMDGRSDMYGEKVGRDYFHIANVQPGWKEILKKYDIRVVIFDTGSALTAALDEQKEWHSVYSDRVATIFIKEAPGQTTHLIKYPTSSLPVR